MGKLFYQNLDIGILGGGQLGRMLIQAGIDLNLNIHILDPDENAPCKPLAKSFTQGDLWDFDTVYAFGKTVDVITIEIENVNIDALKKLKAEGKRVYPQPEVLEIIQDKRTQKAFYKKNHIPTSDFVLLENRAQLKEHADFLPAVQKLGKSGYDGQGVQKILSPADFDAGFDAGSLLEKLVDFEKEIAVIVARSENGETRSYPIVEMAFHPEKNLVEFLYAPAQLSEEQTQNATAIAEQTAEALGIVGLLAVELFVDRSGAILVNEVAPRPHNSGHQTIKANATSQYEQHLRAILGLPLGSAALKRPAAMVNLLGEDGYEGLAHYQGIEAAMQKDGVYVHLYGKKYTRPFRKMGHVTIIDENIDRLKEKAQFVKETIKVIA